MFDKQYFRILRMNLKRRLPRHLNLLIRWIKLCISNSLCLYTQSYNIVIHKIVFCVVLLINLNYKLF